LSVKLTIVPESKSANRESVGLFLKTSLIRAGLQHILSDGNFDVVPVEQDLRTAQPSLVIVEADRSLAQTGVTIDHIKAACPTAAVVVLADTFDRNSLLQLQAVGANGFCLTTMRPEVLTKVLEIVLLGHMFVPSEVLNCLLQGSVPPSQPALQTLEKPSVVEHPSLHKLSQREAHILRMLMRGDPNKVIANKLNIAEATVKVHLKAILRKIQVSNRTQAAIWASEHLIPDSAVIMPLDEMR
jgi:two-component system nitrate/nitrite response regulator NarL